MSKYTCSTICKPPLAISFLSLLLWWEECLFFSGNSCTFMLAYYHTHKPLRSCFCYTASKMVKLHSTVTITLSADIEIFWKLACKTDALNYKHQRTISLWYAIHGWLHHSSIWWLSLCQSIAALYKIWTSRGTCTFLSSEASEELNHGTTSSHSALQYQSKPMSLPLPQP